MGMGPGQAGLSRQPLVEVFCFKKYALNLFSSGGNGRHSGVENSQNCWKRKEKVSE